MTRKKIAFVTTVPSQVDVFLMAHLNRLSDVYDVSVITNWGNDIEKFSSKLPKLNLLNCNFVRKPNLWLDILALKSLIQVLKSNNFQLVHSISPKAGFLTANASFFVRVPNRIHTFTGQVWAKYSGFKRYFYKSIDKLIVVMNTHLFADSKSQVHYLQREKIAKIGEIGVIAEGSICGVDCNRFKPNHLVKAKIREKHFVSEDHFIFGFVGRICIDKGIRELISAFRRVSNVHPDIKLMLIGDDEENVLQELIIQSGLDGDSVIITGFIEKIEEYLASLDCLILPSYREGFGNVVIEAAACSVPAIATNIYGLRDSIDNQQTGLLVSPYDVEELSNAMLEVVTNKLLIEVMGENARNRVVKSFESSIVSEALLSEYSQILSRSD